jgi:hypothetical protein
MKGESHNRWRPSSISAAVSGSTLLLLVGSLYAAPKKPPSSLQKPGAVVRFSHVHERVSSCKFRVHEGERVCVEQARVPAAAGIDFTLNPEPGTLVSEPSAQREPLNVSLPNRPGTSAQEVPVESGNWTLSWDDQRTLFHVDLQRNFSVQLSTLSGACMEEQGQCARHDDVTSRKVAIPLEQLAGR